MIIKNSSINIRRQKAPDFKSGIYRSVSEITNSVVTSFEPVRIRPVRFDNDLFLKNFSSVTPRKRNYLHKFANLSEHYKLLYNIFDLKILNNFSPSKLKSLFLTASAKDENGLIRFTPAQLMRISMLSDDTLNFIKPFAHKKTNEGSFAYKFEDIISLLSFDNAQKERAMRLFKYNLPSDDLIGICKDKNANITNLDNRLNLINRLFSNNIYEIGLKKHRGDYVISVTTQKEFKTHKYVFDCGFNPNADYKSNIDFSAGRFKNNGFYRLFRSSGRDFSKNINDNIKVSIKTNFAAIGNIVESAEYLKQKRLEIYKHNFYTAVSGRGNFIDANIKLPENMLVNYWRKGVISNNDLIKICTDYAELIPKNDFKYFAQNKVKITPFDNDKFLDIRKNAAAGIEVLPGSAYYTKILDKILKSEAEKLKNIKSEKRMIVVDGLPGAGKSTIIKNLVKKKKNSFYTPDSDEIKTMFSDVYKNGAGSDLVHRASGEILKNEILPRVFEQGKNLIFQTTGNFVSIDKIIRQAANKGYRIDFIQVNTPKTLSLERTTARFNQNGRFMDPFITLTIFNCNNKEKMHAAKIFSHHKDVQQAYIFENGHLNPISRI